MKLNQTTPKNYKVLFLLIIVSLCLNCGSDDDPKVADEIDIPELEVEPIACDECTHVIDEWTTDGTELNFQPGDIICLDGNVEYGNLIFRNFNGTSEKPIIIKNCDSEVAFINGTNSGYGLKIERSSNFKLLGNGGGGDYGIKISTDGGFYLTMQTFTTDFEIAGIEIAEKTSGQRNDFAGIGVKTSPYEDCDLFADETKSAWVMENVIIRNNYIHGTKGEGMYIGHGFYNGRTESQCSQRTYSHSIKNLRIFNNILEDIGLDGIQIKNADDDVKVYNNYINGYAKDDDTGAHDEGIYIGDGTTGEFYNNTIIDGGTGIMIHGMGNLDIYNNVIIKANDYALFAAGGPNVFRFSDGYFNIFNNTFHSTGTYAFAFFDGTEEREKGGIKRLANNIFVAPDVTEFTRAGATLDSSFNFFVKDISYFQFVDFGNLDLSLKSTSPAIDGGKDLSDFSIDEDILGTARPQGSEYDLGAFEYKN